MAEQTVNLTYGSPVDFVNKVLELGAKGFVLKDNTFPRLKGFPITASFVIETDKTIQMEPGLHTIPVPLAEQVYSKEELEAMPIEEMRPIVASRGVKGRDKVKMIKQYLAAIESGKDVVDQESEEDSE